MQLQQGNVAQIHLLHKPTNLRLMAVSQVEGHYFKKQRAVKTSSFFANLSRKNSTNAIQAVAAMEPNEQTIENLEFSNPVVCDFLCQEQRRWAIYTVFYTCYGGLDKRFWGQYQVITGIMNRLCIPSGDN